MEHKAVRSALAAQLRKVVVDAGKGDDMYHCTVELCRCYRDLYGMYLVRREEIRHACRSQGISLQDIVPCDGSHNIDRIDALGLAVGASNATRTLLKYTLDSITLLSKTHKHGQEYYKILYYTYLAKEKYSAEQVIKIIAEELNIPEWHRATYFRKRERALKALSGYLWGTPSPQMGRAAQVLLSLESNTADQGADNYSVKSPLTNSYYPIAVPYTGSCSVPAAA